MKDKEPINIIVAGDVCLDVIGVPKPRPGGTLEDVVENWRLTGEIRTYYRRGGALLLSDMVAAAAPAVNVQGPVLEKPPELRSGKGDEPLTDSLFARLNSDEIVHSVIRAGTFRSSAKGDKNDQTLRVAQAHGFSGPAKGAPKLTPKIPNSGKSNLLVLDDTGNRFRQDASQWSNLLDKSPSVIIHKLHRPFPLSEAEIPKNLLWNRIFEQHRDKSMVVLSADDLRSSGAVVSRQLSWERIAREVLWHLIGSAEFAALAKCRWLIVRFGLDGALCWHCPKAKNSDTGKLDKGWLIYDPEGIENKFASEVAGKMVGYGSTFVAALAAALCKSPTLPVDADEMPSALVTGIENGLRAARQLLMLGFGKKGAAPEYPISKIFEKTEDHFCAIEVPLPSQKAVADPTGDWTILKNLLPGGNELYAAAVEMALKKRIGPQSKLAHVPIGTFGKLSTHDRDEIESYRAICNLMHEYLFTGSTRRPLCFAVFGPPGSGKSFGVQQVAEAAAGSSVSFEKLTFNLSQFQRPEELAPALHRVRDAVLRGCVPLVFFDEFDSTVGGVKLFWLKYLLAPMQDGEFLENGLMHPIGKAIFVFAGGISSSYEEFIRPAGDFTARNGPTLGSKNEISAYPPAEDFFRAAKGKDFVSRLRGYLNIRGVDHDGSYRGPALLRRANVLRFLLKEKAPQLFDSEDTLHIAPGVLRAFLEVKKYEHGVRSLEALLDMSMLEGRDSFEPGCLPSPAQMSLHVVAKQKDQPGLGFLELVHASSPWPDDARERIAQEIHEHYLEERKKQGGGYSPTKESHQPWSKLNDFYKDSNCQQADDIPRKLRILGLDYIPSDSDSKLERVSESLLSSREWSAQIDDAARAEHERWCAERRRLGWSYGKKENIDARIHPNLTDWSELDEKTKAKDIVAIQALPRYVKAGGFAVVKLK